MKHIQVVSVTKPIRAEQWSWISLKQIFGFAPITVEQEAWLDNTIDTILQK